MFYFCSMLLIILSFATRFVKVEKLYSGVGEFLDSNCCVAV